MNVTEKLYKFIKITPDLFSDGHSVHTPQPLVEEILGQIDLVNKDILVLFNVEFVASLVYTYNVNPDRITFYSDSANKNRFAVKIGVKYTDIMPTDMKFDVVVGNPPYADSVDSGGTTWARIISKVFSDIVKNNGLVAMIHPPSFIGKHRSKANGKSDYSCFFYNQIEQIHLLDDVEKNKYFPKEGTKICWYIARKHQPNKNTVFIGYDNNNRYQFEGYFPDTQFLPKTINRISMSIHQKLIAATGIQFNQKRELHYHSMKLKKTVSDIATSDFPYKSYFSHKITRYSSWQAKHYSDIKLMVPQTSTINNSFVDKDCNVSEDLYYVVCPSIQAAYDLRSYLLTELVTYIGKNYRPGRNLGSLLMSGLIPTPDTNFDWTQEEIDYIETAVK